MKRSGNQVLKSVSRSFYLSLRLLPAAMRRSASLGYLLARTSDTVADSCGADAGMRAHWLDQFLAAAGSGGVPRWPAALLNSIPDAGERHLLESTADLIEELERLPDAEAALVREVLATIVSGQKFDLVFFDGADGASPRSLPDDAALEDYCWRVAGSVGVFWTKLGVLTLGARFSDQPPDELAERGGTFGKGLQLVNILRDVRTDLAMGRCYLPVIEPLDAEGVMAAHRRWAVKAGLWVREGEVYAAGLGLRRLRAASALPAMLARETLALLEAADWQALSKRIKMPRRRVYQALLASMFSGRGPAEAGSAEGREHGFQLPR